MTTHERDIKILQLLSEGKKPREIKDYVDIGDRTIEYRIDVLKAAHEAKNIPHLIRIAIQKKLIKI